MAASLGTGMVCSFWFHVGLKEVDVTNVSNSINDAMAVQNGSMLWFDWLKEWQFYLVIFFDNMKVLLQIINIT